MLEDAIDFARERWYVLLIGIVAIIVVANFSGLLAVAFPGVNWWANWNSVGEDLFVNKTTIGTGETLELTIVNPSIGRGWTRLDQLLSGVIGRPLEFSDPYVEFCYNWCGAGNTCDGSTEWRLLVDNIEATPEKIGLVNCTGYSRGNCPGSYGAGFLYASIDSSKLSDGYHTVRLQYAKNDNVTCTLLFRDGGAQQAQYTVTEVSSKTWQSSPDYKVQIYKTPTAPPVELPPQCPLASLPMCGAGYEVKSATDAQGCISYSCVPSTIIVEPPVIPPVTPPEAPAEWFDAQGNQIYCSGTASQGNLVLCAGAAAPSIFANPLILIMIGLVVVIVISVIALLYLRSR